MSVTTTKIDSIAAHTGGRFARGHQRKKPPQPKFGLPELTWILVFAIVPAILSHLALIHGYPVERRIGSIDLTHLTKWATLASICLLPPAVFISLSTNRDRTAAIIAAALCSTSIFIAHGAFLAPVTAIFTLLLVCSYGAINIGYPIVGSLILAAATAIRPEGALFAVAFFALAVGRKSKNSGLGASLYIVATFAATFLLRELPPRVHPLHFAHLAAPRVGVPWIVAWVMSSPFVAGWWFLFPFCGELANADSRRKYLPIIASLLLYFVFIAMHSPALVVQSLMPATPFLYMLIGVGLARIMPLVAGDIPGVGLRYTVAIVSALAVIGVTASREWTTIKNSSAPTPIASVAKQISVPVVVQPALTVRPAVSAPASSLVPVKLVVQQKSKVETAHVSKVKK